jgi:protein gp37
MRVVEVKHGTAIEWTHGTGFRGETWNPATGCSKVSAGCLHCYAEELSLKRGWSQVPWSALNAIENVVLHPERVDQPRRWRDPRMIFTNSMSDMAHELIPYEFFAECLDVMRDTPRHVYQILTKRPERMRELLWRWYDYDPTDPPGTRLPPLPNVWVGVSIENRKWVGRADVLRDTPAAVRFISAEPLLGPLIPTGCSFADGTYGWDDSYTGRGLDLAGIDWLIVGGESGSRHRPMDPAWVRDLRDACRVEGTSFFFKQDSGSRPGKRGRFADESEWPQEMPGAPRPQVAQGTLL